MNGLEIGCKKTRTDHELLWAESRKKWRVSAVNNTTSNLYLSWAEAFTNPFTNELWIKTIDDSPEGVGRLIAELETGTGVSFVTMSDRERRIAPHRFVQISLPMGQSVSWIMERVQKVHWDGFNIYQDSLVETIRDLNQEPEPIENIMPRISGGWFS